MALSLKIPNITDTVRRSHGGYLWPPSMECLENLIVVNFKLCDNYACLCYCAQALERDAGNKKAIEYKSKVYLEMPFVREYMKGTDFVPIPVD